MGLECRAIRDPSDRKHLKTRFADKVPISTLCDEYEVQPGLFYNGQKQMLDNMEAVIARKESLLAQEILSMRFGIPRPLFHHRFGLSLFGLYDALLTQSSLRKITGSS